MKRNIEKLIGDYEQLASTSDRKHQLYVSDMEQLAAISKNAGKGDAALYSAITNSFAAGYMIGYRTAKKEAAEQEKKIADNLKKLRGKQGIAETAAALCVSERSYRAYEAGERIPRDEVKRRIADHYNKSVADIFS